LSQESVNFMSVNPARNRADQGDTPPASVGTSRERKP
jgi:hypothetical protein